MITIGYSTRESNPKFQEYLKKTCGHPKVQVIEKVNNGEKNLSTVYNEIIQESIYDIVILCHDDIYFDTKNWSKKISKLKNFIDRLILKEKGLDEIIEDKLLKKDIDDSIDLKSTEKKINPLLVRNIRSIKKLAKDNGITVSQLIKLIKDEQ